MISFIMLNRVDKNLKAAKNSNALFGGINIIFVGDFFQLDPVTNKALHYQSESERILRYPSNGMTLSHHMIDLLLRS